MNKNKETRCIIFFITSHMISLMLRKNLGLDIDPWLNKFLHFVLLQSKDWKLAHQIFLKQFAMELNGQIHPSIHLWQYFGMDSLMQLLLLHGTQRGTGGKDGQLLGQIFPFFLLMDRLISDKMFSLCLETAIGSLRRLLALSILLW